MFIIKCVLRFDLLCCDRGSRNVLAAGIFSLIYLALYFKHITKKFLALIIVCGVFTLMILELYRYANNITDAINFIMNGGMEVILFAFESFHQCML